MILSRRFCTAKTRMWPVLPIRVTSSSSNTFTQIHFTKIAPMNLRNFSNLSQEQGRRFPGRCSMWHTVTGSSVRLSLDSNGFRKSSRSLSTSAPNSSDKNSKHVDTLQEVPVWKQLLRESLNIPNALTFTRLLSTPGLAYLIWIDQFELAIVACFFTGVLDWFDGYLARKWKQHTVLGSFLDPLADKVFVGALLGTLTAKGLFPFPLAALVIGRDVALLGGSFIYRGLTKPKDVPFFATTGKGVIEVKPTFISKVNTVFQMSVMGFALTKAAYGIPNPEVFTGMCWIVGGTTLLSGIDYANMKALHDKSRRVTK